MPVLIANRAQTWEQVSPVERWLGFVLSLVLAVRSCQQQTVSVVQYETCTPGVKEVVSVSLKADSHIACRAHAAPQHGRLATAMLCCGLEKNGMVRAWHGRGMASVNQTRLHCVNQMGKTHSKPLAARHDWGTAWARHAMCESAFSGG